MNNEQINKFFDELDQYYHKCEEDENYYPASSIKAVLKAFNEKDDDPVEFKCSDCGFKVRKSEMYNWTGCHLCPTEDDHGRN